MLVGGVCIYRYPYTYICIQYTHVDFNFIHRYVQYLYNPGDIYVYIYAHVCIHRFIHTHKHLPKHLLPGKPGIS